MDHVTLILSALVSGANALAGDVSTEELRPHFDYLSRRVDQALETISLHREPRLLVAEYARDRKEWRDLVGAALTGSTITVRPNVLRAARAIVGNLPEEMIALVRYPGDPEVPPPTLPPVRSRPRRKRKMTSAQ